MSGEDQIPYSRYPWTNREILLRYNALNLRARISAFDPNLLDAARFQYIEVPTGTDSSRWKLWSSIAPPGIAWGKRAVSKNFGSLQVRFSFGLKRDFSSSDQLPPSRCLCPAHFIIPQCSFQKCNIFFPLQLLSERLLFRQELSHFTGPLPNSTSTRASYLI